MDLRLDPESPLAHQVFEDVRALFAARLSPEDDGQAVWDAETSRVLTDLARDHGLDDTPEDRALLQAFSYYACAWSFIGEQLLRQAAWRVVAAEGSAEGDTDRMDEICQSVIRDVFESLVAEGRTIA